MAGPLAATFRHGDQGSSGSMSRLGNIHRKNPEYSPDAMYYSKVVSMTREALKPWKASP